MELGVEHHISSKEQLDLTCTLYASLHTMQVAYFHLKCEIFLSAFAAWRAAQNPRAHARSTAKTSERRQRLQRIADERSSMRSTRRVRKITANYGEYETWNHRKVEKEFQHWYPKRMSTVLQRLETASVRHWYFAHRFQK